MYTLLMAKSFIEHVSVEHVLSSAIEIALSVSLVSFYCVLTCPLFLYLVWNWAYRLVLSNSFNGETV